MLTLAAPLPPNFIGSVTPIAFSFTDGHLTIEAAALAFFQFQTGPSGEIVFWHIILNGAAAGGQIETESLAGGAGDNAFILQPFATASNDGPPGIWATVAGVPDAGSTLSLMTLTLMALGIAARRFKRAVA